MSNTNYCFDVFPEPKFARVRMWDAVDGEAVLAAMTSVYSDPRWSSDFDVVWDLRDATQLLFEWDDFHEFIELDDLLTHVVGAGRDLFLVSTPMQHAVVRSYAILANRTPRKAVICRTEKELARALTIRQRRPRKRDLDTQIQSEPSSHLQPHPPGPASEKQAEQ